MKKKEKNHYQEMTRAELQKAAGEIEARIVNLSVKRFTESQKNTRSGKALRNSLAVIKTVLRQKALLGGIV